MNHSERKKTIRYIAVFSFLVTGVAFISPLLGGSPSSFGPGFILWGTAPLLVAVLIRAVTRDWSDAGFKPAIRKNARWYLMIIVAYPVMLGLTALIGTMVSVSSFSGFSMGQYLKVFLSAFPLFYIFAIFEELGWRGYLVPKLASLGINAYLASAIVAVVWATWHLPFINKLQWVYSGVEDPITFIPRFYLAFFALAILYNEIRLITGSVWPVVLFHCFANSVGHPLIADFIKIMPGNEYLVSANGLFMIAFTSLLGIALNRWRMRKRVRPGVSPAF